MADEQDTQTIVISQWVDGPPEAVEYVQRRTREEANAARDRIQQELDEWLAAAISWVPPPGVKAQGEEDPDPERPGDDEPRVKAQSAEDERFRELLRAVELGVLLGLSDDPGEEDRQATYIAARAHGLTDAEAREEGWPSADHDEPHRPPTSVESHMADNCACAEGPRCVPHDGLVVWGMTATECAPHEHEPLSDDLAALAALRGHTPWSTVRWPMTPERRERIDAIKDAMSNQEAHAAVCPCRPMEGIVCRPHTGWQWASWVQCGEHRHDAASSLRKDTLAGREPERSAHARGWDAALRLALKQIDGVRWLADRLEFWNGARAAGKAVEALLPPYEPYDPAVDEELVQRRLDEIGGR